MDDFNANAIWDQLLAGQWVVVERRDRSSERTLVLRKATEHERAARAFTAIEREVVQMAMRAWSLKVMAAELGLSTSRVAEVLAKVRSKLGATTHADLIRMVGSFARPELSVPVAAAKKIHAGGTSRESGSHVNT
jgi:DNA-binding NarL/FixJ family response regulator